MKNNVKLSVILITLLLTSCKKEEEEATFVEPNYYIEKITLNSFEPGPNGSSTWDDFVGNGPDCRIDIRNGDRLIYQTEMISDLTPGFHEFSNNLPRRITNVNSEHLVLLIDEDGTGGEDTMAIIPWTPISTDPEDFTLNVGQTQIEFEGYWF